MVDGREQRIRERAYFLWRKEGCPEGQDEVYWQRAALLHDGEGEPPMVTPLQADGAGSGEVEEALEGTFPASDPPSFTPAGKVEAAKPEGGRGQAGRKGRARETPRARP